MRAIGLLHSQFHPRKFEDIAGLVEAGRTAQLGPKCLSLVEAGSGRDICKNSGEGSYVGKNKNQ